MTTTVRDIINMKIILILISKGIRYYNGSDPFVPLSASTSSSASLLHAVIIDCLLFHKLQLCTNTADSISFLPPSVNKPFIGLFRERPLSAEQEQFSFLFFHARKKQMKLLTVSTVSPLHVCSHVEAPEQTHS